LIADFLPTASPPVVEYESDYLLAAAPQRDGGWKPVAEVLPTAAPSAVECESDSDNHWLFVAAAPQRYSGSESEKSFIEGYTLPSRAGTPLVVSATPSVASEQGGFALAPANIATVWVCAPEIVRAPPPPRPTAPPPSFINVVVGSDPVTAVSDIQSGDGSFALDGQLIRLLQRKKRSLTLNALRASIPMSIRSVKIAEKVWGTVLAVAYMLDALSGSRAIWESLLDKARDFVCRETNLASYQFNQLVQTASAQL